MEKTKFIKYLLFLIINLNLITADALPYYVFVNSVPKCGTHLLMKALSLILNVEYAGHSNMELLHEYKNYHQTNFVYGSHVSFLEVDKLKNFFNCDKIKKFLIIRDPRDFVVSLSYYMKKHYASFNISENEEQPAIMSEILLSYNTILYHYDSFALRYLNNSDYLIIKFEDLIGVHGGGTYEKQKETLIKMIQYLELEPSEDLINYVINNLFGDTGTFREGKIGSWKDEFNFHQKVFFHEKYNWLISALGYSLEW